MIRKYGLVFIVSLVLGTTSSWAQQLPTSRAEIQLSFAPLVAQVSPAVVNIYTKTINKNPIYENPVFNDPFFKEFFEDSLFRQAPQV